jgi:hypothetical protein
MIRWGQRPRFWSCRPRPVPFTWDCSVVSNINVQASCNFTVTFSTTPTFAFHANQCMLRHCMAALNTTPLACTVTHILNSLCSSKQLQSEDRQNIFRARDKLCCPSNAHQACLRPLCTSRSVSKRPKLKLFATPTHTPIMRTNRNETLSRHTSSTHAS